MARRRFLPNPGGCALDDPSSREQDEALGGIATLDDFERPFAFPRQGGLKLFTGTGSISEDVSQPEKTVSNSCQHIDRAVAVLNVSGVDHRADQKSFGVGQDMALTALTFLPAS